MQSFSQHGQDAFVYETFFKNDGGQGFFVDVGAYDGVTFSNSLFFERHLGWSGICIAATSCLREAAGVPNGHLPELRRRGSRREG
jgi:hypothetical protein